MIGRCVRLKLYKHELVGWVVERATWSHILLVIKVVLPVLETGENNTDIYISGRGIQGDLRKPLWFCIILKYYDLWINIQLGREVGVMWVDTIFLLERMTLNIYSRFELGSDKLWLSILNLLALIDDTTYILKNLGTNYYVIRVEWDLRYLRVVKNMSLNSKRK